jgi:BirA family biotin operon repressor/biotin-[acetyl-CoA-carboxylase] ligase
VAAFRLDESASRAGYEVESFETIGSTSAEACRQGRLGRTGPLWFVSDHQTAGRGRRGNAWATPPGNLAASLLLSTDLPPATIATLGFVAGLALHRALECCLPLRGESGLPDGVLQPRQARFSLKWPNDVLADGAKLAGILLETEQRPNGRRFLVIGIGVNVAHVPDGLPYRAASLAGLGLNVTADLLFTALSREWLELAGIWDEGQNFAEVRRLWLQRAAGLGADIVVRNGSATLHGTFETLDAGGQLVVRLGDGSSRCVSAGDIYFGVAATVRSGAVG